MRNQPLTFFKKMFVDEKRQSPLTNFNGIRGQKITETDHNKIELICDIQTPIIIPKREELFNFKSRIRQETFLKITNNSAKFRNSFKSKISFKKQATQLDITLKSVFHQSFRKVRGKKRKI